MSTEPKKKKISFDYLNVSDIEKNSYRSIIIKGGILGADQEWFVDNLNVASFKNGDQIIQAQEASDWLDACSKGTPAWCYYEGNENFGKIYNLAAIIDPRGLAPEGFSISDLIDFSILSFNAQEYEPVEKNTFSFDLDNNWRLDPSGVSTGGLKLMGKEHWKKKGKNICGLEIIGSGWRNGGSGLNKGFSEAEQISKIWLKPSGWYFKDSNNEKDFGWLEINNLKLNVPGFSIDDKLLYESINSNTSIELSSSDFEIYNKKMLSNHLQHDTSSLSKNYPVKQKEQVESIYFNHAIDCLFGFYNTSRRNGLRNAVFASGKNQMWFSSAENITGAFVRPFRYV
jgi:uncharacterized protein (TIGR02145 family)